MLRNGFDAQGNGLDGLEVNVVLRPSAANLFADCSQPDVLTELKRGPDGRTSGIAITNGNTISGELLFQRVFFDVTALRDWTFQPDNTAWVYGNFTGRKANRSGGSHQEPLRLSFHGPRLPRDWE